jgi:hypothetical protein
MALTNLKTQPQNKEVYFITTHYCLVDINYALETCRKLLSESTVLYIGVWIYSKLGTELFKGNPASVTNLMDADGNERLDV